MHTESSAAQAHAEKSGAALSSLGAAVFLTTMKLVVGLATNSLGILSEAAHSGLDLLAAGVTYLAVRYSSLPADERHPYGHGKIENLSALVETVLLLVTCVWIVHEAVLRLFVAPETVDVTWASFAVMAVSIAVDVTRSRMLKRMAEKHSSQALEADALHFSTDVWSSAVVLLGLGCVGLAAWLPRASVFAPWLERADAVAALGVSGIVVWVSLRLGRRAVDVLLDGGSAEVTRKIRAVLDGLPEVRDVSQVRARLSGPEAFVDLTLEIPLGASFEQAHAVSARAEDAVRSVLPGADVVVHLEPAKDDEQGLAESVRALAARRGLGVHGIVIHHSAGGLHLEMHVEVPEDHSLGQAHDQVTGLEEDILRDQPEPLSIVSHIEPVGERAQSALSTRQEAGRIRREVERLVASTDLVSDCHKFVVHVVDDRYFVSFHCRMAKEASIAQAHEATARLEEAIRAKIPVIGRVVIHVEPTDR